MRRSTRHFTPIVRWAYLIAGIALCALCVRLAYVYYLRWEVLAEQEWTLEWRGDEVHLRPVLHSRRPFETVERIAFFPETTHLDLGESQSQLPISVASIVRALPQLRHLELGGTPVSSFGDPFDIRIVSLSLRGTPLVPRQLETISQARTVEKLRLTSTWHRKRRLTAAFAPALRQCTSLESLEIEQAVISIECVQAIADLPRLRRLRMKGVKLPDFGWEELATSPALRTIEMGAGSMLPDQVGQLADSPTIENLVFENDGDDLFLPSLFLLRAADLPHLKRFEVRYGRFDKVPFDRVSARRPDLDIVGEVNPPRRVPGEH